MSEGEQNGQSEQSGQIEQTPTQTNGGGGEPRIGVFICHCGHNIGGYVDVPAVVEYAKTIPNVVHAEGNLYTCADDGLTAIKEAIKEHKLDRVIVASCTPRTHAPLFQSTCESEGLNKYLFNFVNIREQCSWVHMKEKDEATEKAKDLIRMGIARARLLEAKEEPKIDIEPVSLVIGGGISGMTAALSLARQGFEVHLVEREASLGGLVKDLNKLWLDSGKTAPEVIKPLIDDVTGHEKVNVYMNSEVKSLDGHIGNFNVIIEGKDGNKKEVKVGTIIVATGAREYIPEGLYGYEQYDNVVTLAEFEILAKNNQLPPLKNVAFIQCVGARGQALSYCSRICCAVTLKNAIYLTDKINKEITEGIAKEGGSEPVAGSDATVRSPDTGASKSIRERRRRRRTRDHKEKSGDVVFAGRERANITVFNRTICSYGVHHELYYNKAREKRVKFIRYTPDRLPEVSFDGNRLHIKYLHKTLGEERMMDADMIVLATPLVQQPDARELSKMLKVPVGQDGFFLEAHVKLRPVDFATDGIFICGTARAPADITESVDQAYAAASHASIPMGRGYVQAEALTSVVDQEKCTGCGTCLLVCPYNAIKKNEDGKAEVMVAACHGCGACGSVCPELAITMTNYTDEQLFAEAVAALREVV